MSLFLHRAGMFAGYPGYLLNQYPGAAAAYSLRVLSSAFASSAVVRVRRSSDNAEADFAAAEITDGTLTTWTGANDGFVVTWYDQSGNARDATQATAGNQPQIVASGVLVTDPDTGQESIRFFDNSGSAAGQFLDVSSIWHSVSDAWTGLFSVYTSATTGNLPVLSDDFSGTTINRGLLSFHQNSNFRLSTVRTGGASDFTSSGGLTLNERYLRVDKANRSIVQVIANGNDIGSVSDKDADYLSSDNFRIGSTRSNVIQNDFYISEMVYYAGTTEPNVSGIYQNIKTAWSPFAPNIYSIGDSTVAAYLSQPSLLSLTTTDLAKVVLADPGDTIAQQLTAWDGVGLAKNADKIIVQIGLNNLASPATSAGIIAELQDLIDNIRSDSPFATLYIATMTPARQRFVNLWGETEGEAAYQRWLDVNESIRGEGGSPITNVDVRISSHTDDMNDGSGNLKAEYDTGDGIHPNLDGRTVNAAAYSEALQ